MYHFTGPQIAAPCHALAGRMHRSQVHIADPCPASWEAMPGDAVRQCSSCDRPVHDLSALRHDEAQSLLRARASAPPCVRYVAAADGTLRFRDLVPRASLTRRLRTAVAASLLAACTPHGDTQSPESDDPPLSLAAERPQLPDRLPPVADECDPVDPPHPQSEPHERSAEVPLEPSGPTLEDQQIDASVRAALRDVDDRIRVLDESEVIGRFPREHEWMGVALSGKQAEADSAERARLLELERQALAAEADAR